MYTILAQLLVAVSLLAVIGTGIVVSEDFESSLEGCQQINQTCNSTAVFNETGEEGRIAKDVCEECFNWKSDNRSYTVRPESLRHIYCNDLAYNYTNKFEFNLKSNVIVDLPSKFKKLNYTSMTFLKKDMVLIGWHNLTYVLLQNASNNGIVWEGVMGKGDYIILPLTEGVYKISSSKRMSVIAGTPKACPEVGHYVRNDVGLATGTEFYAYIPYKEPGNTGTLDIFAYHNGTLVKVTNAKEEVEYFFTILDKGEHASVAGHYNTLAHIISDKPVSVLTNYDNGYYVPAKSGLFKGKEFFTYAGDAYSIKSDINVIAYSNSTEVVLRNYFGGLIWEGVLNKGEIYSQPIKREYFSVKSNKDVSVLVAQFGNHNDGYVEHHFVPDITGFGLGTEFYTPVNKFASLWMFSFHGENRIRVLNEDNFLIFDEVLGKDEWFELKPGRGIYHIISDEPISILAGYEECGASFVPMVGSGGTTTISLTKIVGRVVDRQNNSISNVEVDLYTSRGFYSEKEFEMSTFTDLDGYYNFSNVPPGSYIIYLKFDNCSYIYSAPFEMYAGKTVEKNFNLDPDIVYSCSDGKETASVLISDMNMMFEECMLLLDWEAELMGEMAEHAYEDLGPSEVGQELFCFITDIITELASKKSEKIIKGLKNVGNFKDDFIVAVKKITKEKIQSPEFGYDVTLRLFIGAYDYISDHNIFKGKNQIRGTELFSEIELKIQKNHRDFILKSKENEIPRVFDIERARETIRRAITNIDNIKEGKSSVIVPINPESQVITLDMNSQYDSFMTKSRAMNIVGGTSNVLTSVQFASGAVALACFSTGIGAPVGAYLSSVSVASAEINEGVSFLEIMLEEAEKVDFAMSCIVFGGDILRIPGVYNSSKDFIFKEIENPYYFNVLNNFSAYSKIDPNYMAPKLSLGSSSLLPQDWQIIKVGLMKVELVNTGNVDSRMRVVSQTYKSIESPDLLEFIYGEEHNVALGADIFEEDLGPLEYCEFKINFFQLWTIGDFFTPHFTIIDVYSGVELVESKEFFHSPSSIIEKSFYEVNEANKLKHQIKNKGPSICTQSGTRSAGEYLDLLQNITKIIDAEIDPVNYTASTVISVDENKHSLDLMMFCESGPEVDLHIYDEEGRHVGYNVLTGGEDIQKQDVYYSGREANPERIIINNLYRENLTVLVELVSPISPDKVPVRVYLLETPKRPAVMATLPGMISETVSPGEKINLTSYIGEAGKQKEIIDVKVNITDLVYNYAGSNSPSMNGTDSLEFTQDNTEFEAIQAGQTKSVVFSSKIPEDARVGRYTGTITVESSNAGTVLVPVEIFVTLSYNVTSPYEGETAVNPGIIPVNINVSSMEQFNSTVNFEVSDGFGNPVYSTDYNFSIREGTTEGIFEIDTRELNCVEETDLFFLTTTVVNSSTEILVYDTFPFALNPVLLKGSNVSEVELVRSDETIQYIHVTKINFSDINTTFKPVGHIPVIAYLVNAEGSGNYTLKFGNISNAELLEVYKINSTSVPKNMWLKLDHTVNGSDIIVAMKSGDPPIVFTSVPDLEIQGGIGVSGSPMVEDEYVKLFVEVWNRGGVCSHDFNISFLDNGKLIGDRSLSIPANSSSTVIMDWKAKPGDRKIKVIVDSENSITESNETNNDVEMIVTVLEKKSANVGFIGGSRLLPDVPHESLTSLAETKTSGKSKKNIINWDSQEEELEENLKAESESLTNTEAEIAESISGGDDAESISDKDKKVKSDGKAVGQSNENSNTSSGHQTSLRWAFETNIIAVVAGVITFSALVTLLLARR